MEINESVSKKQRGDAMTDWPSAKVVPFSDMDKIKVFRRRFRDKHTDLRDKHAQNRDERFVPHRSSLRRNSHKQSTKKLLRNVLQEIIHHISQETIRISEQQGAECRLVPIICVGESFPPSNLLRFG